MIHVNHRCQGNFVVTALCFALFLSLPAKVRAQTLYGSITGNVKDASDAAIVGATVQILNKGTNETRQAATNEAGVYSLSTVQTGTYEITVSMPGFKKYTEKQVGVTLNTLTRVDVKLDVGELTETVTVAAEVARCRPTGRKSSRSWSTRFSTTCRLLRVATIKGYLRRCRESPRLRMPTRFPPTLRVL